MSSELIIVSGELVLVSRELVLMSRALVLLVGSTVVSSTGCYWLLSAPVGSYVAFSFLCTLNIQGEEGNN